MFVSPNDRVIGNSDLNSSVSDAARDSPKEAMQAFYTLPRMAEIGPRAVDGSQLNPSDDFCDSPRERLLARLDADIGEDAHCSDKLCDSPRDRMLAKLENDIGEETQKKTKRQRGRRTGATLKAVMEQEGSVNPEAPVWHKTWTTVMLRNIPNRYTVEELSAELRARDFGGFFDFVYLPIDFKLKKNKGYAFINLISPSTRARFVATFDNLTLTRYKTQKVLGVVPAVNQGLKKNIANYIAKDAMRVTNEWFRPVVFSCDDDNLADGRQ